MAQVDCGRGRREALWTAEIHTRGKYCRRRLVFLFSELIGLSLPDALARPPRLVQSFSPDHTRKRSRWCRRHEQHAHTAIRAPRTRPLGAT